MNYVIYKLTSPSGKIYIGRTKNFDDRLAAHKYEATRNYNRPIYHAIRKYGWDNIIKEIIDTAETLDDAIYKEHKYIVEYDSVRKGYNSTYNTEGPGDIWEGLKDTERYEEFIGKMSEITSGENNGMHGRKHTDSAKSKQKEKAKGRFSLPWFIERYGEEEGTKKYQERNIFLKSRRLPRDQYGNFAKKSPVK